jgi:nucleotide-binding universal stress UspA family protein
MLDLRKLLLPLDLEEPSLAAIHQAAVLARHCHSEIVILHAIRPLSYLGLHANALAENVKQAEQKIDAALATELAGIATRHIVLKGDPARLIVETALKENVGAIVVGPHAHSGLAGRLIGSVTEKILSAAESPIWSCAHRENGALTLPLRNVICGIDFTFHDGNTVRWAAAVAAEFGARLTLAHVTPGVEIYGPGGHHEIPELKQALVSAATRRMHKLLEETHIQAEMFIGSGDVAQVLNQAAQQNGAELLVIGRRASPGLLGGHCYTIICKSNIPVLAV